MKIYIVTRAPTVIVKATVFKEQAVNSPYCQVFDLDIGKNTDFLEATLATKKLEAAMDLQKNAVKIEGLVDLLGCSEKRALQIIKEIEA